MRILILTQFFPPDTSSTAVIVGQLAEDLARTHSVRVVAGSPSYDVSANEYRPREVVTTRVRTTRFHRRSLVGRLVNYASFVISSGVAAWREPRVDLVIATTDPPGNGLVASAIAAHHRAPFVFFNHDLYPDIAVALGKLRSPTAAAAWNSMNRIVYGRAALVVAVSRDMRQRLVDRGAPASKTVYLPTWAEPQTSDPAEVDRIRRAHGWEERFVVMHAGNVGLAQNMRLFVELARLLQGNDEIEIVVLGDGAAKPMLERERQTGLSNLTLLDTVPRRRAQALMAAADLHVVSLAPGLGGCAMPSKTYGIMAAGRPFLAAVDPGAEPAVIAAEAGCGEWVPAGDAEALASAVQRMRTMPLDKMGERGRAAFEHRFSRDLISAHIQSRLEALIKPEVPSTARQRARKHRVVRALIHEATLSELLPAFEAGGVRPILIKGPVTAALICDAPYERGGSDLDLLVDDSERAAAEAILGAHGFRRSFERTRQSERDTQHAEPWVSDIRGVQVDLHRSLALVDDARLLLAVLRRDARPFPMRRVTAEAPSPAACALIIALHAAQHPSTVARPAEDLRLALQRLPRELWVEAASLARELNVVAAFARGLARHNEGAELIRELQLDSRSTVRTRLQLNHAVGGAQLLERARNAGSLGAAASVFHDALFPSPAMMRIYDPSVGPGKIRLTIAYLRRQRRIPATLVAYFRAVVRR